MQALSQLSYSPDRSGGRFATRSSRRRQVFASAGRENSKEPASGGPEPPERRRPPASAAAVGARPRASQAGASGRNLREEAPYAGAVLLGGWALARSAPPPRGRAQRRSAPRRPPVHSGRRPGCRRGRALRPRSEATKECGAHPAGCCPRACLRTLRARAWNAPHWRGERRSSRVYIRVSQAAVKPPAGLASQRGRPRPKVSPCAVGLTLWYPRP